MSSGAVQASPLADVSFGLSAETITTITSLLARNPAIERAIVYGSRAKGNFKPG
jgi:predicted nucleotidyltransferase